MRFVNGNLLQSDADRLIGTSALFKQVLEVIDAVSNKDCVVLLEGESGTGKELLARRIHEKSPRCKFPFIPVNCAATSDTLFESQFYGHVKGAFTGADGDTLGVVRAAEGGSLLLDEVGELPLHLQPKLLRLLQQREITPVGASTPISVDTRFIASTNRSLAKMVSEGDFRSDLYHRLNIVRVEIPPLRSRPQDIEPLLDYFLAEFAQEYNMPERSLSLSLRQQLAEYPWPGNVRELSAYIERLYATGLPPIAPRMARWDDGYRSEASVLLPSESRMPIPTSHHECMTLAEAETRTIQHALEAAGYNRTHAARILNIHRTTLIRKMRQRGLG